MIWDFGFEEEEEEAVGEVVDMLLLAWAGSGLVEDIVVCWEEELLIYVGGYTMVTVELRSQCNTAAEN
jgi:hypothetical protein